MSLGIIITIIFFILKETGNFDHSWWVVFLPLIIEVCFDAVLILGFGLLAASAGKFVRRNTKKNHLEQMRRENLHNQRRFSRS